MLALLVMQSGVFIYQNYTSLSCFLDEKSSALLYMNTGLVMGETRVYVPRQSLNPHMVKVTFFQEQYGFSRVLQAYRKGFYFTCYTV